MVTCIRVLIGSFNVSFVIGQSETVWFWFYDTRLKTAIQRKVIGLKN